MVVQTQKVSKFMPDCELSIHRRKYTAMRNVVCSQVLSNKVVIRRCTIPLSSGAGYLRICDCGLINDAFRKSKFKMELSVIKRIKKV